MKQREYNLEKRLVDYSCIMSEIVEMLPNTRTGSYIASQLIRSCHSPAFNYGEAQAAESRNDFIHKMKIVLKELKECRIALKVIHQKSMINPSDKLIVAYKETEELIAIIAASIGTAKKNQPANLSP
jgi:four helix bundle protein